MKLEIDTQRDGVEHLEHLGRMLLAIAGKKEEAGASYAPQPRRIRPRDITRSQDYSQSYSQIHTPQQQAQPAREHSEQQQQAASTPYFNIFEQQPAQQSSQEQKSSTVQSTQSIFDMFAQPEEQQHEEEDASIDGLQIIPY